MLESQGTGNKFPDLACCPSENQHKVLKASGCVWTGVIWARGWEAERVGPGMNSASGPAHSHDGLNFCDVWNMGHRARRHSLFP